MDAISEGMSAFLVFVSVRHRPKIRPTTGSFPGFRNQGSPLLFACLRPRSGA